jgi:hypothetical protein
MLTTMFLGIRLLHYLGVRRIYLLGVDFKGRDGLCYGFPSDKRERNRRYWSERRMFEALMPQFEKHKVEFFNCSESSALELFPYKSFEEAIIDCKGSVPPEPFDTTDWYNKKLAKEQREANPPVTPVHYDAS